MNQLFDDYEDIRGDLKLALTWLDQTPVMAPDLQRAIKAAHSAWKKAVARAAQAPVEPLPSPSRATAVTRGTLVRAPAHSEGMTDGERTLLGADGELSRRQA